MAGERERLRVLFTEVAELYDRARPGYPAELFDDLAALGVLRPGRRVLEIGCGTGQATVPLAERGARVTAVELGPELAEVARRNLALFPTVTVVTAAFEDWPLPEEPYDLVLAATSFHWLDPAVRFRRTAAALRPGGALATISVRHVAGGSERFFAEVQRCYERFDPATPPGLRLPRSADIPYDAADMEGSGLFEPPVFRRYELDISYTTGAYLDVLRTYSGHRALAPAARNALLECIGGLIDRAHGGRIVKRHLIELRVARLRPVHGRRVTRGGP